MTATQQRRMQWIGLLGFALLVLVYTLWFGISSAKLVAALVGGSDIVEFNKGVQYLLGCIFLGCGLVYAMALEMFSRKAMPTWANRFFFASLALIVVWPNVLHPLVDGYITRSGYQVCEQASHRWLHSQTIVYTQNAEVCAGIKPASSG